MENPIKLPDLVGMNLSSGGSQTIVFLSSLWIKYPELIPVDQLAAELQVSENGVHSIARYARLYLNNDRHPLKGKVRVGNRQGCYFLEQSID